jgi:chaperone BCS1
MDPTILLTGGLTLGVVAGLVAALWSKIKLLAARIGSALVVTAHVEDEAGRVLVAHLLSTLTRSPYGRKRYRSIETHVRPEGRRLTVAFETLGTAPLVLWHRWRPIVVRIDNSTTAGWTIGGGPPIVVSYVRGTFDVEDLIVTAVDAHNASRHGDDSVCKRYRVHRRCGQRGEPRGGYPETVDVGGPMSAESSKGRLPGGDHGVAGLSPGRRLLRWADADLGDPVPPEAPLAYLALDAVQRDAVESVRRWLRSKTQFEERGVPWRMGLCLCGPPGTGKTSFVRCLAQELDLPITAFELATYDNAGFIRHWDRVLDDSPGIALVEDIDAVFKGRENVTAGATAGLTFDCLLNTISGAAPGAGVLLVVTTNDPDSLDPALGRPTEGGGTTRPGRINRVVPFGPLGPAARAQIAARILAGYPDLAGACVAAGAGDTGARFEDRCVTAFLERYWKDHDQNARPDPPRTGAAPADQRQSVGV